MVKVSALESCQVRRTSRYEGCPPWGKGASYREVYDICSSQVEAYAGTMYDAVWLYALAVNETLESGQSIRNGLEVAKRTYNRLYEGTLFCVSPSIAKD